MSLRKIIAALLAVCCFGVSAVAETDADYENAEVSIVVEAESDSAEAEIEAESDIDDTQAEETVSLFSGTDNIITLVESDEMPVSLLSDSGSEMFDKTLSSMETPRAKFESITIGDKIYAIGGINDSGIVSTIEMYDYRKDSWMVITNLPYEMRSFAATAIGNTIYISGGYVGNRLSDKMYSYNIIEDKWETVAAMQTPRERHEMVYANGLIYAIGGRNESGVLSSIEKYNFSTNSWSKAAEMSVPRMDMAAVSQNDKIYIMGGFCDQADNYGYISDCEAYDAVSNVWTSIDRLSSSKIVFGKPVATIYGDNIYVYWKYQNNMGSHINETIYSISKEKWLNSYEMYSLRSLDYQVAVLQDGICIIGGYCDGDYLLSIDFTYKDYVASQNMSLTQGIAKFNTVIIEDELYLIGGRKKGADSGAIYKYSNDTGKWTQVTSMPEARRGCAAVAVDSKIYIIGGYCNDSYLRKVIAYDTVTQQWSVVGNMPVAVERLAAVAVDEKIYILGGRSDTVFSDELYVYDTVQQSWTKLASAPTAGMDFNLNIYNNKLYTVGGYSETESLNCIFEYDILNDIWTTKVSDLPDMQYSKSIVLGDKIILAYQNSFDGSENVKFAEYYPADNYMSDSDIDLEFKNIWYGMAKYDSEVWLIGGYDGTDYSKSIRTIYSKGLDNTYNMATLDCKEGSSYKLHFYVAGVKNLKDKTFIVNYDADVLKMTDVCAFTPEDDLCDENEYIDNTGIYISEFDETEGIVRFQVDNGIDDSHYWYGDVNIIEFAALGNAETNVIFYVE